MRKKTGIIKNSIIFVLVFIILYFLYLIGIIIPSHYEIPVFSFIGFAIIIISIFYFFIDLSYGNERNKTILCIKMVNENSLKVILIVLMMITFFFPPNTFSEVVVVWKEIGILSYFRAIVFLIGASFLPGACIFNLLFPKSLLHEKFNVEPFFLKLVIYPLLSFSFFMIYSLILDYFGLIREQFFIVLFLTIVFLFISDLVLQKLRDNNNLKLNTVEIKISKFTFLILLIAIGIIFVSFNIHLSSKYLIPGDSWRGISYASYIGKTDKLMFFNSIGGYTVTWGYVSFSLSVLGGIPYININALLFPFVYLFIASIYLFMKAILHNLKEIYAIMSTILVIIYSYLFYFIDPNAGNYQEGDYISTFNFDGIMIFHYKSFSMILFLIATAVFIIISKTSKEIESNSFIRNKEIVVIILGSFFLLISYVTYLFTIIAGISLIFIYCLFSNKKSQDLKLLIYFCAFLIFFFILIDVISGFFFTFVSFNYINYFLGGGIISEKLALLFAFYAYSILIGFLLFLTIFYKFRGQRFSFKKYKFDNNKINTLSKKIFKITLIVFTILLIVDLILIFLIEIDNFFFFYLNRTFLSLGFIGILGIYLSYFTLKKNKKLFFILFLWGFFMYNLASLSIFYNMFSNPFTNPALMPNLEYKKMMQWFFRLWYFSIIPLSIVSSVGLVKFLDYLKSKRTLKSTSENLKLRQIYILTSLIISLTLSNTIIAATYWSNFTYPSDEEIQIIGWVSENIPQDSNILVDRKKFIERLQITYSNSFIIDVQFNLALISNGFFTERGWGRWTFSNKSDPPSKVELIEELDNHSNILKFVDQSNNGSFSIETEIDPQIVQEFGTFSFLININNKSKTINMNFSSFERTLGISISIESNAFYTYNGSNYQKIIDIESFTWYNFRIDFESTNGNYSGLDRYNWQAYINGIKYGEYLLKNNISEIGYWEFQSSKFDTNFYVLLDDMRFHWEPNFKLEYGIYKYLIVINYLKLNSIQYYIFSDEITYYKTEAERILNTTNIWEQLLTNFYKNELYKYGILTVYYAPYFD